MRQRGMGAYAVYPTYSTAGLGSAALSGCGCALKGDDAGRTLPPPWPYQSVQGVGALRMQRLGALHPQVFAPAPVDLALQSRCAIWGVGDDCAAANATGVGKGLGVGVALGIVVGIGLGMGAVALLTD